MAETQPTLNSLAAKISELSETFTKYLKENNIPAPTFAADSPVNYSGLSHEMFMTRQVLLDAVSDLWLLAQGPSESIFNYAHCVRTATITVSSHKALPSDIFKIGHARCYLSQRLKSLRFLVCSSPSRLGLIRRDRNAHFVTCRCSVQSDPACCYPTYLRRD